MISYHYQLNNLNKFALCAYTVHCIHACNHLCKNGFTNFCVNHRFLLYLHFINEAHSAYVYVLYTEYVCMCACLHIHIGFIKLY